MILFTIIGLGMFCAGMLMMMGFAFVLALPAIMDHPFISMILATTMLCLLIG